MGRIGNVVLSAIISTVRADLACTEVLAQWYPTVPACSMSLTCSGDFACVVELPEPEGGCATFQCKSATACPEGTNYYPFYPTIDEDAGEQISASQGYACYPPDEVPDEMFECEFDTSDFSLVVNAQVPEINRKHDYDERNITLISWDAYLTHNDTGPWLIFDKVDCRGVVDPIDGVVRFTDVQNGQNDCFFTNMGLDVDEIEVPYYIQKFVIGYDDLVDWKPSGQPAYKRYGKNWIVNCRIKAWDTGYVNPAAQGERDELEIITETEIVFKFEMFRDDLFTVPFDDGDSVDIGADSIEDQAIFVQATAEIANPEMDYMLHLKYCKVRELTQNQTTTQWSVVADEFDFMVDGCLSSLSFVANNFVAQPTRVQWADANEKTYILDQFKVDLWEPISGSDEIQIFLECTMVLCSVPAFAQPAAAESICKLPENSCQDRYDNLQSSIVRRSATRQDEEERQEVEISETDRQETTLTFKRNTGNGGADNDPSAGTGSSACTMLFSMVLMCVFAFL